MVYASPVFSALAVPAVKLAAVPVSPVPAPLKEAAEKPPAFVSEAIVAVYALLINSRFPLEPLCRKDTLVPLALNCISAMAFAPVLAL
jgi:hypothetical protein